MVADDNKNGKGNWGIEKPSNWAENLIEKLVPEKCSEPFLISIIIPTLNSSEKIGITLDSIKNQTYKNVEVIIIDAGSTDRTLEVISDYYPLIARTFSVTDTHFFEMLNKGISFASGLYITFLNPGDCYLSTFALQTAAHELQLHREPDLLYFGWIERERKRIARYHKLAFKRSYLEKGVQSTLLSSGLFRLDLFDRLGKFNVRYSLRADFDFLVRLSLLKDSRIVELDRTYIDHEGFFSYSRLMRYASDTWSILKKNFGIFTALSWILGISYLSLLRWGMTYLKSRFTKV